MTTVLDASAIIAMILSEPGWEAVAVVQSQAAASTVNISEVVAKLCDRGADDDTAREAVARLHLEVIDFDLGQAMQAGSLRRATRARGLSLGERACLALALARHGRVLTTDRAWTGLDLGVEIEVIR